MEIDDPLDLTGLYAAVPLGERVEPGGAPGSSPR